MATYRRYAFRLSIRIQHSILTPSHSLTRDHAVVIRENTQSSNQGASSRLGIMDMAHQRENALFICASCWRILLPEDKRMFELHQWVNPITIMARLGDGARQHIRFVDTYCIPCLIESALCGQSARRRAANEPLNA